MGDFSETPFGDPYFAAVAHAAGHHPDRIPWDATGERAVNYAGFDAMPAYAYGKNSHTGAWLKIETSEGHEYHRSSDGTSLLIFRKLPLTLVAGLAGMRLDQLINDPYVGDSIITDAEMDEDKVRLVVRFRWIDA